MADNDRARQRIIASVFDKRNAAQDVLESYVAHIKIWEDTGEGQGRKPRYILISRATDNSGFIHKSKLNTNGTFSVGKTWRLAELRGIQIVNSVSFNITLARTYKWQTDNATDQTAFVKATIDLFRSLIGTPLHLVGVDETSTDADSLPPADELSLSSTPPVALSSRLPTPLDSGQAPQTPHSHILKISSRSASPADSMRNHSARESVVSSISGLRPPSPSIPPHQSPIPSLPSALRPRVGRRPSIATPPPSAAGAAVAVPSSLVPARAHATSPRPSLPGYTSARPSLDLPRSSSPSSTHQMETHHSTHSELSAFAHKPPSRTLTPKLPEAPQLRREHNNRVSFFDPANQVALDRLVAVEWGSEEDAEGAEETAEATMISVEEMFEGYEWASDDMFGRKSVKGAADLVEARLLDELMALDKANIHSFLETDDRVNLVIKYLDEALGEIDAMDSLISSYKIHLNAVGDDISFVQSQRRGLQVQMQNQGILLSELENLLKTVQVSQEALVTLTQESLEKQTGIQRLEEAATELYKALQASQDREMAATMERLNEYRTYNAQFCKRIFDYLSIMIVAQSKLILDDNGGIVRPKGRGRPIIFNHQGMESYLGRYAGLLLYLKEMDETVYSKFCAAYFSAASDLHNSQMKGLFAIYSGLLKKAPEEDVEQSFAPNNSSAKGGAIRRAGTLVRGPPEARNRERERGGQASEEYGAANALGYILEQITPQIYREGDFIADFLQINDAGLTFADYAGLDSYFRRQAARSAGLSQSTTKLVRGAMDLIFGFLPTELKQWIDIAIAKDALQLVGVIACLERFLADADERGNTFFLQILDKQHLRLKGAFDRHIVSELLDKCGTMIYDVGQNQQIKMVDETKLTSKKRKGAAHFIKYFPVYVGRVEQQLIGADGLEIRTHVDSAYEKIVHSMFECLKQMATLDGDGEDKGQLNYHVLLVENMHYFVAEMSQLDTSSAGRFLKQAEAIYNDNLGAYVKIVLRRPFAKLIEFFEGVERVLKTTAPSEVQKNTNYSKTALKKAVKEFDGKDVRKHIDALFRRVEKHFTEAEEKTTKEESSGIAAGTVMVGVWKACEEELLRMTEGFRGRIVQCYGESGVAMEYTSSDVESAFKRHRLGG